MSLVRELSTLWLCFVEFVSQCAPFVLGGVIHHHRYGWRPPVELSECLAYERKEGKMERGGEGSGKEEADWQDLLVEFIHPILKSRKGGNNKEGALNSFLPQVCYECNHLNCFPYRQVSGVVWVRVYYLLREELNAYPDPSHLLKCHSFLQ